MIPFELNYKIRIFVDHSPFDVVVKQMKNNDCLHADPKNLNGLNKPTEVILYGLKVFHVKCYKHRKEMENNKLNNDIVEVLRNVLANVEVNFNFEVGVLKNEYLKASSVLLIEPLTLLNIRPL